MSATEISVAGLASRQPPPAPRKLSTSPALCSAPSCCSRKRSGICCAVAIWRAETSVPGGLDESSIIARIAYSSRCEIFSIGASVGTASGRVNGAHPRPEMVRTGYVVAPPNARHRLEMRVLGIDDEPDVLLLCRVNLEIAGHEVLEAADGLSR